jgi:ubiquinone/menaquinone biosynthesis C-methylase UbiE
MEYYDIIALGYNELHKEEQLKKYRLIQKNLGIGEENTLLDVGCGTGFSFEIFRCRITGIDSSKDMLKESKKASRNTAFVQGKAEHLPFKNEAFDIIICVSAFHNFKGPRKALEEMKRVGKGKGVITIMRKARKAQELRTLVEEMFKMEKVVEEDKDSILFFSNGSS